jgi:hypothetical protein
VNVRTFLRRGGFTLAQPSVWSPEASGYSPSCPDTSGSHESSSHSSSSCLALSMSAECEKAWSPPKMKSSRNSATPYLNKKDGSRKIHVLLPVPPGLNRQDSSHLHCTGTGHSAGATKTRKRCGLPGRPPEMPAVKASRYLPGCHSGYRIAVTWLRLGPTTRSVLADAVPAG